MGNTGDKAWRCAVCGYVHHGAQPPECCPICGAPASDFEPYAAPAPAAPAAAPAEWRCLNCNYVHTGPEPPECCPVCGVGPEQFEPVTAPAAGAGGTGEARRILVVGAGIAGVSAAESARKSSPDSEVTLLSRESALPYYRLNLTRYLAGEIQFGSLPIHPAEWYDDRGIGLELGIEVAEIDRQRAAIALRTGDVLPYDRVVLAMGSHPFVPPVSGVELPGATTLRTTTDADRILAAVRGGGACVCIGGGVLGLETAGALARQGADVTLLESHEWLMPRQLTRAAAERLERHLGEIGIKVRKQARTAALEGAQRVERVRLEDGTVLPAGLAVLATGVRPNSHLARRAGLEVNRGIVVDGHLATSDPALLAAGDVAEHNGRIYGLWGASEFQGAIAGLNAAGIPTVFGGLPRSNSLKVLGLDLLSIGRFEPADGGDRVLQGEDAEGNYRHFLVRDGVLSGAILLGDTSPGTAVKKAIAERADVAEALRAGATWAELLDALRALTS